MFTAQNPCLSSDVRSGGGNRREKEGMNKAQDGQGDGR